VRRFHSEYSCHIGLQATPRITNLGWKKLKQRATHTSHPLSQSTPKWNSTPPTKTKSWLKFQPPPPIYRPSGKDWSAPTLGDTIQALTGAFWSTYEVFHWTAAHPSGFASSQCKHLDHVACCPLWSFSTRPDPVFTCRAFGLGFVAQPCNPMVLWGTAANLAESVQPPHQCHSWLGRHVIPTRPWFWGSTKKPYMTPYCLSCHHVARTWSHSANWSIELSLLVSPLLGGPTRLRPFAPALHMHQRKSRHNLHLQYSTKSQSTPCCQSLITPRSDHPPVLGRSGSQGAAGSMDSPWGWASKSTWWVVRENDIDGVGRFW
jgi:hypothetical protein